MADNPESKAQAAGQEGPRPVSRRDIPIELRRARRSEVHKSQTYMAFIKRLEERGGMSPHVAEQAAVSVLCALEQRIVSQEAEDLEAQLPRKLIALLHRCERHEDELPAKFGRPELLAHVGENLGLNAEAVEPVVRAVLGVIREEISEGEAEDVMGQLPADLRDLWSRAV